MSSPPPIRAKLLRILLLPLVSMAALWGFIAYSSVQEISDVSQTQDRWEAIGSPVLQLIIELQRERQLSAEAPRSTGSYAPLLDQRRNTDVKVDRLREVIGTVDAGEEAPAQVRALVQALDGLQSLRASADGGVLAPPLTIIEAYNNLIAVANRQFTDRDALSDVSSFRSVRGMAAYVATAEYLGREHAVLTATIVQRRMSPTDRAAFVAAMSSRRLVFANAERDAGPELKADYDELVASLHYRRVVEVEDELFTFDTGGPPPVEGAQWKGDAEALLGAINRDTQAELARAAEEAESQKSGAYWRVGIVLLLGLAAMLVSLALSYRFGRSLIEELRRLQASAVELAEERLPRLVERLRRGDDVDPATEAPGLDPADTAEVDRVVDAFSAVRRTAVEAAVGQAALRKGVGQVFLNLARRNQALLHRQLALLDTMERRVDEPEVLEDLFKLDHLTTRMRRHAENLIILSDAVPARRWRDPVQLFDVVRAAVLEVEDYTRVTVAPMPQAPMLVGAAVTDVIHLVAELVENATVFSPPDTSVQIRGMTAANGFALEVEDRGLGLNQDTLDQLNARLADPPEFDLDDSDRLGLFVVSRLAARHGIKISLRRSPYDGTTAIVLLPGALLAGTDEPARPAEPVSAGRPVRALDTGHGEPAPPAAPEPRAPLDATLLNTVLDPVPDPVLDGGTIVNGHAARPGDARPEEPVRPERGTWFDAAVPPGPPAGWSVTVPPQEADDDLDGLPMRVPQASLAPQLRTATRGRNPGISVRTPEELAQLMSSMQQGWQQGRRQADERGQDVWNRKDDHPDARPQK
ncbi:nitrate- and nitrite sensing domain-containing protein [Actinomadura sp. ATCC 31491]|uniref:histidine kinase n=1 Tax=Actinomadura luzonensis TaxID=2805427 RepID=A0ABT0G7U3_9ACTN|nr:nitrate- and nitrite sensing domain-containing protein [Actinomadura luzonensis]MCK2220305.1 nitrate- and nitrite sensing domain-containing protein [Actinomadura luzonensis]